jgi:hypothetical protein
MRAHDELKKGATKPRRPDGWEAIPEPSRAQDSRTEAREIIQALMAPPRRKRATKGHGTRNRGKRAVPPYCGLHLNE